MNPIQIKKLLSLFMFGKLSRNEYQQLHSEMQQSGDEDLKPLMEELWNDNRTPARLATPVKQKILNNITGQNRRASIRFRWLRIAAAILLPLLLAGGVYQYMSVQSNPFASDMTIIAEEGQKVRVHLPDGSLAWLNSRSTLSYPAGFGRKKRSVKLTGEGYFEIAKNSRLAFYVETEKMDVQVHGTKFNVSAYPEKHNIQVSLIEGSVSVEDKNQVRISGLSPLHTIKVNKENLSYEIINEDTSLTALWSQDKCQVENATAEETFKRIGYWYGLNIHMENINTNYRYGFTIKEESFREFMELINKLTPLEYHINGEEVTVRYK